MTTLKFRQLTLLFCVFIMMSCSGDNSINTVMETLESEEDTIDQTPDTPDSNDETEDEAPETPDIPSSQDPNFHIYLSFGQSNMDGTGYLEDQDYIVDERFKTFQAVDCPVLNRVKETWYTAEAPLSRCLVRLSVVDYFGRTMVEKVDDNVTIGIINVAVGGSNILLYDKDQYQNYNSKEGQDWFNDIMAAYNSNPYQYLMDLADLAQQEGVIKGILLHQGETNSGDTEWPSYVNKVYTDMLADLSLSADKVPLLAGEMLRASGNCCSDEMNPIINTLPDVIPTAHVISSEGCTGQDSAHFDAEGYREMGRRYAEKMFSLIE